MLADFGTPVTGFRIGNDGAWIVVRGQRGPDEFVEPEPWWAADLMDTGSPGERGDFWFAARGGG